ncbi:MAG: MetS family NSS transporter small subunit [Ignavibacterium sp.]|nr:MAG: MetS family NSS transporter small subunit [Ignavibacterium sp.]
MEVSTIITMVIVLGIVWGGLILLLLRAINYEKHKSQDGEN